MAQRGRPPRTKISLERFGFKRIKKPTVQGGLSSTVLVDDLGYINLGFTFELVKRAGLILPRGISPSDPAFMTLKFDIKEAIYKLYVQYVDERRKGERHLLLDIPERPEWITKPTRIAKNKEQP